MAYAYKCGRFFLSLPSEVGSSALQFCENELPPEASPRPVLHRERGMMTLAAIPSSGRDPRWAHCSTQCR